MCRCGPDPDNSCKHGYPWPTTPETEIQSEDGYVVYKRPGTEWEWIVESNIELIEYLECHFNIQIAFTVSGNAYVCTEVPCRSIVLNTCSAIWVSGTHATASAASRSHTSMCVCRQRQQCQHAVGKSQHEIE
jgi:hypothetical protein